MPHLVSECLNGTVTVFPSDLFENLCIEPNRMGQPLSSANIA